ncbi:L,D-transpeptidase [Paenibacillus sp. sptzw28]|uniref:L,D-transpeptidase n=1 Tax=Paenibacillus sp. sptzw28 TaxID=715179 RepID=UPI001C6DD756|nr:L,D-transpeptidase [Paenibacillus sp. sptzw28]QYR23451.1 L,D-transpeptidase [Paenibacillus sp. sptzw28]
MEQRDDMSYLKRYVQNHPNNRMAWYLLGKQYMLEGKEAKANYCFLQAGSIYEAYERKRHPLASEPQQMIAQWNRKRRLKMLAVRSAAAMMLLLAAVLADPFAGHQDGGYINENEASIISSGKEASGNAEAAQLVRVVFVEPSESSAVGTAIGDLMDAGGGKAPRLGLAAMLQQEDSWRKWTGDTRMILSMRRQGMGEAFDVTLLDATTCDCQPADAADAYKTYNSWSREQEERWTLSSAIIQYRSLFDRWPKALEDMVRPYPNNVLAGETKQMRSIFPDVLESLKASDSAGASVVPAGGGGGSAVNKGKDEGSGSAVPLTDKPVAIIVDKDRHQLAVVSGDVIIRSYTVGLGGSKTPSGSFYISEKVKNPNGREDGEFGSRGMTLSGTRYAIHGTNEPGSIGGDESHGCIRMRKEDVEELYDLVPLGTQVDIKSGVLPFTVQPPAARFKLTPMENETNPAVVYRWLH